MKYALDTNIFIDGFRSHESQAEVFAFLNRALPFTFLSAVVMQELAAGARTTQAARDVEQRVFEPFERRRRVFAPSGSVNVAYAGGVFASRIVLDDFRRRLEAEGNFQLVEPRQNPTMGALLEAIRLGQKK